MHHSSWASAAFRSGSFGSGSTNIQSCHSTYSKTERYGAPRNSNNGQLRLELLRRLLIYRSHRRVRLLHSCRYAYIELIPVLLCTCWLYIRGCGVSRSSSESIHHHRHGLLPCGFRPLDPILRVTKWLWSGRDHWCISRPWLCQRSVSVSSLSIYPSRNKTRTSCNHYQDFPCLLQYWWCSRKYCLWSHMDASTAKSNREEPKRLR